jgi:hypothetical protein
MFEINAVPKLAYQEPIAALSLSTSTHSTSSFANHCVKLDDTFFHSVELNNTIHSIPQQGQTVQGTPLQKIISPAANYKHNRIITVLALVALGVGSAGVILGSPYIIAATAVCQLALLVLAVRKNYNDHKNKIITGK